jgi:hypothetical protein
MAAAAKMPTGQRLRRGRAMMASSSPDAAG